MENPIYKWMMTRATLTWAGFGIKRVTYLLIKGMALPLVKQIEKDRYQWDFQDPKMEVLYHIRPYFGGISPYIALT